MGNHEDGFCSRSCDVKNGFVEDQLDKQSVWERRKVVLLEESEIRGKGGVRQSPGTKDVKEATGPTTTPRPASVDTTRLAVRASGAAVGTPVSRPKVKVTAPTSSTTEPAIREIKSRPLALASSTLKDNPGEMTELLSGLMIHERPTPSVLPTPPDAPPKTV